MRIDVWMQHPTLRFLRHEMFESIRRWTGKELPHTYSFRPAALGRSTSRRRWVEGYPGSEQPVHVHGSSEQIYFICHGSGVMRLGDATYEVEAGSLVFIAPGVPHAIRNNGNEALVFVTAAAPVFELPPPHSEFAYEEPPNS